MNNHIPHRITRRQFTSLLGIGIAGIGAAALTGCAARPASQKEQDQSNLSPSRTETYDVVVIGSGGAGTSAAAMAAGAGAKTVCLEKLPWQGGSSSLALGTFYGAGTQMQKERGIEDSTDALYDYFMQSGGDHVDAEMNRFMADHAGETIDWLSEDLHVPFKDEIKANGTDKVKRGHMCAHSAQDALTAVRALADENGVEFKFGNDAYKLEQADDGSITGVVCHTSAGDTLYKAGTVIIANGGFCRNEEMINQYCPDYRGVYTETCIADYGDGVRMGMDAGGAYYGNGGTNGILYCSVDAGQSKLIANDVMWVNPDGMRFTNEAGQTHDIFYTVAKYPSQHFYAIYDQAKVDSLDAKLQRKFNLGLEKGIFTKADTAEEAARSLGLNGSAVQSQLDQYNQMAQDGQDTQFKKNASLLKPLTQAPYYVLTMGVCTHGSFGGLETNTNFQVLDQQGNIIPHLYSAGEVCCGTFIYQNYPAGGCGLNFSYTSGRFAGKNAAEEALHA